MQGTLLPAPYFQALDAAGVPLPGSRLYFFEAGTSTPATVYTDAALTTPHATPVECDSAGRVVVYLGPSAYKLQVKTAADVLVREVDPVAATAPYNVNLDVLGVAGESLPAGAVVYLSGGDGGTTAGRWYQTDADVEQKSSLAAMVGMVPRAIASGAIGTIRLSGKIEGLAGLTAGTPYYVSATAGALTASPPTHARLVGVADSGTTLVLFGGNGGGITVTSGLSFVPLEAYGSDQAAIIATINASTEGGGTLRIAANKIHISGLTTFAAGYDPSGKIATGGAAGDVNAGVTTITGDKIRSGSIESNNWPASGSQFDLVGGSIKLGGSSSPKLHFDGATGALTVTGNITSGSTITGSTVTGGTLRTGSGNGRVQMTESPNELAWFDSDGSRIGTIDADGVRLELAGDNTDVRRQFRLGALGALYQTSTQLGLTTTAANAVVQAVNKVRLYASHGSTAEIELQAGGYVAQAFLKLKPLPSRQLICTVDSVVPSLVVPATLGTADAKWENIHLNLPAHTGNPAYIVCAHHTDITKLGYIAGYSGDVTISGTTLRIKGGVITAINP